MALKDLPPEGQEVVLNFIRALARWSARRDYDAAVAEARRQREPEARIAPPDPANAPPSQSIKRRDP